MRQITKVTGFACLKRSLTTTVNPIDQGKRLAAFKAVDDMIHPTKHSIIGLGSGSTIEYAIQRIASKEDLYSLRYVPTSFQTRSLILQNNLRLATLEECKHGIDVTIDGADEVDTQLNAIKGGGGCLFQERLIAQSTKEWIIIADDRKKSDSLGTKYSRGVPVEIVPMALTPIQTILSTRFPNANIQLRMATPTDKAGPVVTDNGNLLLDCHFGSLGNQAADLYQELKLITGVVEVGLFCNLALKAYFGRQDGTVDIWSK